MGRTPKPWQRKGRPGWFAEIAGSQHFLGLDKRAAELEFHRLRSQHNPQPPGKHSLAELVAIYLHWCKPRIRPKTYRNYYASLQSWVDLHHGVRPADLRVYHLDQLFAAHPNWGPTMCCMVGRHVKTWSAWSDARGYLDGDRLRAGSLPTALKRDAAPVEDLEAFERAITEPFFRDYFWVLYDTGARPGEVRTLTADRCRWETRTAIVTGKTGDRVIGLTNRATTILRLHDGLWGDDGPILRTAGGAEWNEVNRCDKFREICHAIGVEVVPYSLRHALYLRWHNAGVADIVIAKQLGHISKGVPHLALLKSTYAHVDAIPLANAAAMAEGYPSRATNAAKSTR